MLKHINKTINGEILLNQPEFANSRDSCLLHRDNAEDLFALIIVGPTASGKSALADRLAQHKNIEVINIDSAQCYKPFSIGTAKPDLSQLDYPAHLFDLIDKPQDLNACHYRVLVQEKIKEISSRGNLPVIVGGSHFYVRSLFFPPHHVPSMLEQEKNSIVDTLRDEDLWHHLNGIDPERALLLHPHDVYRLRRALAIWYTHGRKPSELSPTYNPLCKSHVIAIMPEKNCLRDIIHMRAEIMLRNGWIEEAEKFIGTPWESFVARKGFIGYEAIFDWIKRGKEEALKKDLLQAIVLETMQYAKRQVTFLAKLLKDLQMQPIQNNVKVSRYASPQEALNEL